MALSLNQVNIAGNLTRDPQVRFLANEKAVADFGLAINERYTSNGEKVEKTTFVEVTVWGRQAELVGQYLTKGRACLVEGSLEFSVWEDKQGNKRNALKVTGKRVHFLGDTTNHDNQPQQYQERGPVAPSQPVTDEEPF